MSHPFVRAAAIALCGGFVTAVAVEAATADIDQAGQMFSKKSLTVKPGDTVRFHNGDDAIHNINVIDAADVASDKGLQKPGETIGVLFDKAGKFVVRCSIHPKMKMTIAAE